MAHIHEKIDFTTTIYIVRDGKVLLHKHKKSGIWLPPGGHIELDEDPNEAALREAKEESGFDVRLFGETTVYDAPPYDPRGLIPPKFINRHFYDATHTHEHVDLAYFATVVGGELRPEEQGGEIRWFSRDEIERNEFDIVPDVREYALSALQELGVQ